LVQSLPDEFSQGLSAIMDKAYEGDTMRQTVVDKGMKPVVPPKSNRKEPWEYDRELYKQRNQVERYFRRLKAFRRVFTRYDKLDKMYFAFVQFANIAEFLRE
jgi:transposase